MYLRTSSPRFFSIDAATSSTETPAQSICLRCLHNVSTAWYSTSLGFVSSCKDDDDDDDDEDDADDEDEEDHDDDDDNNNDDNDDNDAVHTSPQ